MSLLHVSYDPVRKFVPRVPHAQLEGEDGTVHRICVAQTIEDCINAKAGKAAPLIFANENGIPVVLYVYAFDKGEYIAGKTFYNSCHICRDFGVRDAILTAESWLLAPPRTVKKRTLLVQGFELEPPDEGAPYPRVKTIQTKELLRRPPGCLQSHAQRINKKINKHLKTDRIFTMLHEAENKQECAI